MASLTPFAEGSPLAVSAPLIGNSVPILLGLPPAAPEAPLDAVPVFEQPAITRTAVAASAPILASFMYDSSSSRVRLVANDPGRTTRPHPVASHSSVVDAPSAHPSWPCSSRGATGMRLQVRCDDGSEPASGRRAGGRRSDAVY